MTEAMLRMQYKASVYRIARFANVVIFCQPMLWVWLWILVLFLSSNLCILYMYSECIYMSKVSAFSFSRQIKTIWPYSWPLLCSSNLTSIAWGYLYFWNWSMLWLLSKISVVTRIPFIQQVYFTLIFEFCPYYYYLYQASDLTTRILSFLLYKMGITMTPISKGYGKC